MIDKPKHCSGCKSNPCCCPIENENEIKNNPRNTNTFNPTINVNPVINIPSSNEQPTLCSGNRNDKNNHNVVQCGDCCLINQRFTIEQNISPVEGGSGTFTVYKAVEYEPSCVPGASNGNGEIGVQQVGTVLPFGSLIVSNVGINPFTFTVFARDVEEGFQEEVQPGAQVAFSGIIGQVDISFVPNDPIRALFTFDIFLIPPNPV